MKLIVQHYAPSAKGGFTTPNTDLVWVVGESENLSVYGYVKNVFNLQEIGVHARLARMKNILGIAFVTIESIIYKEHSNGGRTNEKEYASVYDYTNDPVVWRRYREWLATRPFGRPGDPDQVDAVITVRYQLNHSIVITTPQYSETPILPSSWYSDHFFLKGCEFHVTERIDSVEEAIASFMPCETLFGTRSFGVATWPSTVPEWVINESLFDFKGYSQPIHYAGNTYIGLKVAGNEEVAVKAIYESGGKILKHKEWDW